MLPVSMKKTAVIIEVKAADTFNSLENESINALKQISEKKYDYELKQTGYSGILSYGIAFYKKDCMVKN